MFFELVSILLAFVPDYGNEYTTEENKNWTSFKNFAPKLNLNHNIYLLIIGQQNGQLPDSSTGKSLQQHRRGHVLSPVQAHIVQAFLLLKQH